jgi:nucleoside-diphosphate-sugar epimerase
MIEALVVRGHSVDALVRPGSESKLPRGANAVVGNALELGSWTTKIEPGSTFVHLIGTPSPAPWKASEFERVDLVSLKVALEAAKRAKVSHFVYLSVAQPAPIMKKYIAVRAEGERLVRESGLAATFARPWYVLGPTHRWPYLVFPIYWVLRALPWTRAGALRLDFVTLPQMTRALVAAIEAPPSGVEILDVPKIREAR